MTIEELKNKIRKLLGNIKFITLVGEQEKIEFLTNILENTEKVVLNFCFYDKIVNGVEVKVSLPNQQNVTIVCKDQIIGIGNIENGKVKLKTFLLDT